MTGLQILADGSHVSFKSSPGKAAPDFLFFPQMTHMVSSPLIVSTLTFRERKYCSPSQSFDRAEFHDLSLGRGDILGSQGADTDKGRQMTSRDLGSRVIQKLGRARPSGTLAGVPWE
jgi:hypothetical protein